MKHRLLYMCLGFLIAGTSTITSSEEPFPREKVREHIVQQLRGIDFMLESLGQSINNYRVYVANRKATFAYILEVRETLQKLINEQDRYSEGSLLYRNRKLIDIIAAALESDFSKMGTPSYEIDESVVEDIDTDSMETELLHRDTRIQLLTSYSEVLGLSTLNVLSRSLSDYGKETGLTAALTRALPYLGWAAYWQLMVKGLKEEDKTTGKITGKIKKDAMVLPPHDDKHAFNIAGGVLPGLAVGEKFMGVVTLETLPTINFGIGVALSGVIQRDVKDLCGFATQCGNRFIAYCKGELFNDGSGYLKPVMKHADVIGAHAAKAELVSIVDYFKDKVAIDRIGASVDRSYFLAGPLDTSKSLAHATAGEITAVLKSQGRSSECSLIEVHASSLVNKSLKDVMKDAEKRAPCIVVLEEIDVVHAYGLRKVKSTVWGDLIGSMSGLSKSRKDVFVITTASTDTFAGPDDIARYGVFGKVENPTHEDRIHFFKKELERRGIALVSFDLEALANKTAGYTFNQLTNVLKRACAKSQSLRQSLSQAALETAIAAKEKRVPASTPVTADIHPGTIVTT